VSCKKRSLYFCTKCLGIMLVHWRNIQHMSHRNITILETGIVLIQIFSLQHLGEPWIFLLAWLLIFYQFQWFFSASCGSDRWVFGGHLFMLWNNSHDFLTLCFNIDNRLNQYRFEFYMPWNILLFLIHGRAMAFKLLVNLYCATYSLHPSL
jgi:hypothetical protein